MKTVIQCFILVLTRMVYFSKGLLTGNHLQTPFITKLRNIQFKYTNSWLKQLSMELTLTIDKLCQTHLRHIDFCIRSFEKRLNTIYLRAWEFHSFLFATTQQGILSQLWKDKHSIPFTIKIQFTHIFLFKQSWEFWIKNWQKHITILHYRSFGAKVNCFVIKIV